jgi:hypothetical protein
MVCKCEAPEFKLQLHQKKKRKKKLDMVVHACNLSHEKQKLGGLQFKVSLSKKRDPTSKKKKKTKKT